MSRMPWEREFPDAFVNAPWASKVAGVATLRDHALYNAAKGERDVGAALQIIDDLADKRCIYGLADLSEDLGQTPTLIAPACQPNDSNNALAIGYAQWLSHELDWPVETRVFQSKTVSRDFQGSWVRIANRCNFYGEIDKSAAYVIVDDVITTGGTLADLRSFILRKGGRVIGMSAIAARDGNWQRIRLDDGTRANLEQFYGRDLAEFCHRHFGFSHECFTEAEARAVLGCSGYVDLGKKVLRARNS
jgi:hypothetical protein